MPRRNKIEVIVEGKDQASEPLGNVSSSLKKLATIAGAAVAAVGVAKLGQAFAGLVTDAAAVEGVSKAFGGLTQNMEGGSARMLSSLKSASGGMIEQADLMQTFNKAAQLVSVDFAKRLPDAMGALGKVAAATGQDMGFLMDSMVTGVGRMSPMILDNLAIQVDLTKANEDYAASLGKSVSELTKQEQQVGLMNQVVEKLAENTAAMPDITDTAAAKMQQFKTSLKDAGLAIGTAFLPLLNQLMSKVLPALNKILPKIVDGIQAFSDALIALFSGAPADFPWEDVLPPELAEIAYKIAQGIENVIGFVRRFSEMMKEGRVWSFALKTALAEFAPELANVAIGFIDFIRSLQMGDIQGALEGLTQGFADLWTFIQPHLATLLTSIQTWFTSQDWGAHAQTAIDFLAQAFADIWTFLQPGFEALWQSVSAWFMSVDWMGLAVQAISLLVQGLAQFTVLAAETFAMWMQAFLDWSMAQDWEQIGFDVVTAIIEGLLAFIELVSSTIQGWYDGVKTQTAGLDWGSIGSSIVSGIADGIKGAAQALANAAAGVVRGAIAAAKKAIGAGSPSALAAEEIGKPISEGIGMGIMNAMNVPIAAARGVSEATIQGGTTNNFNMTVNTAATVPTVQQDFQTMAAMSGAAI